MTELPMKACWTAAAAEKILQTEALATRQGAFLAVHQPIRDLHIGGSRGGEITEPTDEGVLRAIARPESRHVFCAVEGEPGSGKSHLIRWLRVKWPVANDLVLLIQRADGSLPGALRELREALGEDYGDLFDRMGQQLTARFEGRVAVFQSMLANSLAPDHFETPLEDTDACKQHELAKLFDSSVVRSRWKGPERVLAVMSGMQGQRDQAVARFNLYDIADLAMLAPAVNDCPSPRALRFLNELRRESRHILPKRKEGESADRAAAMLEDAVPSSRLLMNALNRRRDYSIQYVLGISVDRLKEIFFSLRRQLKSEGRRLVLLLEDITAWEGLDSQLIDVLVTDSMTRQDEDLCDLISVVGLTPRYMSDLKGNYRHRITHRVTLGQETGQFFETNQLATPERRDHFAANYLRAVRVGLDALDQWMEDGAQRDQLPNRCATCPVRSGCHTAFGAVDGIGLFPFTTQALTHIYESLADHDGRMTLQTPRGMIQGVLTPVLTVPGSIDEGAFPPYNIESHEWLPQEVTRASGRLELQFSLAADRDPETTSRLRRLVMLWGANPAALKTVSDDGALRFAGIAKEVFESFRLPWPGAHTAPEVDEGDQRPPRPESPSDEQVAGEREEDSLDPPGTGTIVTPNTKDKSKVQPPASALVAAIRRDWTQMLQHLSAWREGKPLASRDLWDRVLTELVRSLPRHRFDVPEPLFDKVFSGSNIKFASEVRSDVRYFLVPKEDWLLLGLEAHVMLAAEQVESAEAEEDYRRYHARMIRRLGEAAEAHLRQRLPALSDGGKWSMAASAAQVLLARAWLRGEARPAQPLADQYVCLLSEEGEATTNPRARVGSWQAILQATDKHHTFLRSHVRKLLSLPQGSAGTYGLANAGAVAAALRDMQQTLRLWPVPAKVQSGLEELGRVVEVVNAVSDRLKEVPRYEGERLALSVRALEAMRRRRSLKEHTGRVDTVLEATSGLLTGAAQEAIAEWRASYNRACAEGFFDDTDEAAARRVEDFIVALEADDDEAGQASPAEQLSQQITAPAAEVRRARELLLLGEKAVRRCYDYARDYVTAAGSSEADAEQVHQFGERVQASATRMLEVLEETA